MFFIRIFHLISNNWFEVFSCKRQNCKVFPLLNYTRTMPRRCAREWRYRSAFSWPQHYSGVGDYVHALTALTPKYKPQNELVRRLDKPQNKPGQGSNPDPLSYPACSLSGTTSVEFAKVRKQLASSSRGTRASAWLGWLVYRMRLEPSPRDV
jgi:hypothetical protein